MDTKALQYYPLSIVFHSEKTFNAIYSGHKTRQLFFLENRPNTALFAAFNSDFVANRIYA